MAKKVTHKFSAKEMRIFERFEVNCRDIQALLGSYVDEDLPPSLRSRLLQHIVSCSACQEFEITYRLVINLARDIGREEPIPADVHARFRSGLRNRLGI